MSTRFQWFTVHPFRQKELKAAEERLLQEKYDDARGYGVLLRDTRGSYLTGQYVEKTVIKERVVDPFGKEMLFERPQYRIFGFRLAANYPELELVNPLRSLGQFLTFIGDCLSNRVTIEPITFSPTKICEILQKKGGKAVVQSAVISRITLSSSVSAEAAIHGSEDVSEFIRQLVGNRKYEFSGGKARLTMSGRDYYVDLSSSGRARLMAGEESGFTEDFRRVLVTARE